MDDNSDWNLVETPYTKELWINCYYNGAVAFLETENGAEFHAANTSSALFARKKVIFLKGDME